MFRLIHKSPAVTGVTMYEKKALMYNTVLVKMAEISVVQTFDRGLLLLVETVLHKYSVRCKICRNKILKLCGILMCY